MLKFGELEESVRIFAGAEIAHAGRCLICGGHEDFDFGFCYGMRVSVVHDPAKIMTRLHRVDARAGKGDVGHQREIDISRCARCDGLGPH